MPTYLYGVILSRNAGGVGDGIAGIDGSVVRVIPCGALGAIVSDVDRVPSRSSLEHIRAHDAALRAVVSSGITVAASRFGQFFADDRDACRGLDEHAARVETLLGDLDGCVEMRVLLAHADVPSDEAASAASSPGRAYLEQLKARAALAAARTPPVSLAGALGPVVRRERVEIPPDNAGVVVSHLVRREEEGRYRAAINELPALNAARVIGPLPLYSFADE